MTGLRNSLWLDSSAFALTFPTSFAFAAEMDLAMLQALEASRNEIDDEDSSLQRAMEMSLRSAPPNHRTNSNTLDAIGN